MIAEVYQSAYGSRLAGLATAQGIADRASRDCDKEFGTALTPYRQTAAATVSGALAILGAQLEAAAAATAAAAAAAAAEIEAASKAAAEAARAAGNGKGAKSAEAVR